ncbi:GNAT family N-acetyltransferase [soil metagenome]
MSAADFEVRELDWADPLGEKLRDDQKAEVSARYAVEDSEPGPKPTAADITSFFVAFDRATGEAVGCGALRELDPEHGEVKRMYVAPDRRGSGAATAVLQCLEQDARERGWTRVVLETGTEQQEAVRFYEREGYTAIPPYGYYIGSPWSLCYEKVF